MRNAFFAPISFEVVKQNGNSNDTIQSYESSFKLLFFLQIELKANLLDQNMNELENELSRM